MPVRTDSRRFAVGLTADDIAVGAVAGCASHRRVIPHLVRIAPELTVFFTGPDGALAGRLGFTQYRTGNRLISVLTDKFPRLTEAVVLLHRVLADLLVKMP